MQHINKKTVAKYLYDQLTGNFIGFVIGVSATGLVSQFFETRGIKNLWGLSAKKTVIDKETFSNFEWVISIIVGFVVFEIFMKLVKGWLDNNLSKYKYGFFRWIIKEQLHLKVRIYGGWMGQKRMLVFTAVHHGVRQAFNRYSNAPRYYSDSIQEAD
jgi:hypothetical protein